jgi:UDP-glucose 4,6-dehydratase
LESLSSESKGNSMIVLLGSSGYFGRAFAAELRRRGLSFIPLTRRAFDYTRFDYLFDYLRTMKPAFLINAAGYSCRPEEDGLEAGREQAMLANALLPQMIARVCLMTKTPWGHLSSGSIYTGAKILEESRTRVEKDLSRPGAREMFENQPQLFTGFNELDEPNFCFRYPPCSFHSGTKALAEEAIRDIGQSYIWRPRLAFSDREDPRNFLWQFQREANYGDTIDSLSHTDDCVRACLDLWKIGAPFGIYNLTNPGAATTRHLAETMRRAGQLPRPLDAQAGPEEPVRAGGKAPQSHCILDVSKLLATGVKMRGLEDAWQDCLHKARAAARLWQAPAGASPPSPAARR